MNKVITINLGGNAYQLEEAGYDALRAYLEDASARLQGNPDREEIVSDIETAIAEKFRALLASHKNVVETKEVHAVIADMGPIEADAGDQAPGKGAASAGAASSTSSAQSTEKEPAAGFTGGPRRLYRISEGAMLGGVCNGIAAYLNIDPTFVRLAFVFSVLFFGSGFLVYFILMLVIPEARTPEQKAAASGFPSTAQEFIRRAKEGYYEGIKSFQSNPANREWQRRFKRDMRGWRRQFRREMRDHWRYNWQHEWWGQGNKPRSSFVLPFVSLLHGVLTIVLGCALISVLSDGNLFGHELPSNVPVWVAVILLILAYSIFVWPLKMARRACYWSCGQKGWTAPNVFFFDSLVWLAVAGGLAWLAFHYFPEFHKAVQSVPTLAHQACSDISAWWNSW